MKLEPLLNLMYDQTITVIQCGRICTKALKISLSRSFAGLQFGVKEMEEGIWVVSFMDNGLGYFDERGSRVEPLDDPFRLEKCKRCVRYGPWR